MNRSATLAVLLLLAIVVLVQVVFPFFVAVWPSDTMSKLDLTFDTEESSQLTTFDTEESTQLMIFQIGCNHCGTTALFEFFESNNLRSHHWTDIQGGSQSRILEEIMIANVKNHLTPLYPLDIYGHTSSNVTVFLDFNGMDYRIGGHYKFEILDRFYPNSVFILNYRFANRWLKSRIKSGRGGFMRRQYQMLAFNQSEWEASHSRLIDRLDETQTATVIDYWYEQWWNLTCAVLDYFVIHRRSSPNANLVLFDIETEDGTSLVHKLQPLMDPYINQRPINPKRWGQKHKTNRKGNQRLTGVGIGLNILNQTKKYAINENSAIREMERQCRFPLQSRTVPNFFP